MGEIVLSSVALISSHGSSLSRFIVIELTLTDWPTSSYNFTIYPVGELCKEARFSRRDTKDAICSRRDTQDAIPKTQVRDTQDVILKTPYTQDAILMTQYSRRERVISLQFS